jgi:hypothetical protein
MEIPAHTNRAIGSVVARVAYALSLNTPSMTGALVRAAAGRVCGQRVRARQEAVDTDVVITKLAIQDDDSNGHIFGRVLVVVLEASRWLGITDVQIAVSGARSLVQAEGNGSSSGSLSQSIETPSMISHAALGRLIHGKTVDHCVSFLEPCKKI